MIVIIRPPIKEIKYVVMPHLTILVNRCIKESYFPACFKLGKVIPVHKSGSLKDQKNYRPITITSVIIKVIACVIYEQLTNHIDISYLLQCLVFARILVLPMRCHN